MIPGSGDEWVTKSDFGSRYPQRQALVVGSHLGKLSSYDTGDNAHHFRLTDVSRSLVNVRVIISAVKIN